MQIKRLKLSGFKSFVEPAELHIEPGLTGVVGPNGCGKSNILEAIRWVMGESSPRSMRSSGMEDVIFAGTTARPARDFAEVTMLVERTTSETGEEIGAIIAKGKKSASADDNEVEITRRIERGAGSAYRVNGRDVRAKDISLLFADAATGAHSPALVSQNRIGSIISAKPAERRQMLEEAAGISGLHVRRKDAEQKLRAAEANLVRLDEMLGDMEQRVAALKRQARAAERYRQLTDKIRTNEARLIYARWREADLDAEVARREAELATSAVEKAAEAQRGAAAYQAQAAQALAEKRFQSQAAREKTSALGHKLASLRAERDGISNKIADLAGQQGRLQSDRDREAALDDDARAACARLEQEEAQIAQRIAAAETGRKTIDIRTLELENAAHAAETVLSKARASQAVQQAEARVAEAATETARAAVARAEAEIRHLQEQMAGLGEEEPLAASLRAARLKREQAEEKLATAAEAMGNAEAIRQQAAAARDAAESEGASARAILAALQSEAEALGKAIESTSGDRAINYLKAQPGYERILAAALGDDLDAALTGDAPRRWAGASKGPGDPALPAGCIALSDYVDAPPALARRLAQIGVADADDGSINLAVGQRLVTRDGRLRRWDGYIASGLGSATAERLIRLNRLNAIERALPAAKANVEEAGARTEAALQKMLAAREAADAARAAEAEASAIIREAGREEDAATVALERLDFRRTGLAERIMRADTDLAAARHAASEAETMVAALPDAGITVAEVADFQAKAEAAQLALAGIRAEAAAFARSISADRERAEAAGKERADWQNRALDAEKRFADLCRRIVATGEELARLADAPERLAGELAILESEFDAATTAAEAAISSERQAEEMVRETEKKLAEVGEALSIAREQRAGAVARNENQESRRNEMIRTAKERFECAPDILPEKLGFDPAGMKDAAAESSTLEHYMAERERIGPVNLIAEQELAEIEEGRTHSQSEREELGLAINRLRGSIGSLNREGRARLLLAFEAVDRHFQSLFTTLFEGGQAHLQLIDADDPLEAGLEIMAQPPGKRLSALTLLSGGEQALTAIALIFALFLTNPAPICVLDEVDAPLDDANIERFCNLLDRMTNETDTRYLIVTHNAVTMSRMHRLFGVTMIEKGISRLVSVDLGGAERLLAAE